VEGQNGFERGALPDLGGSRPRGWGIVWVDYDNDGWWTLRAVGSGTLRGRERAERTSSVAEFGDCRLVGL